MHLLLRENVIDFTKLLRKNDIMVKRFFDAFIGQGKCHWLHQALHESWDIHPFQETRGEQLPRKKNNVSIVLLNLGLMQNPNRKHFTFVISAQNQFVQTNIKNIIFLTRLLLLSCSASWTPLLLRYLESRLDCCGIEFELSDLFN